jgi:hypothetical protein
MYLYVQTDLPVITVCGGAGDGLCRRVGKEEEALYLIIHLYLMRLPFKELYIYL